MDAAATVRPGVRAPVDSITPPPFIANAEWVNVATLRMDQQMGKAVLIEFFDFCRVSSLRTLPYVKEWHSRYEADGLRVISVHCPGYPPSQDPQAVREAVARLGIEHAVCLDQDFELWRRYENKGWPARYLFNPKLRLFEYHYGEGSYTETEQAIQELLDVERELVATIHPEDDPAKEIVVPTPEQEGPYSGAYEAGEVWAVVDGEGELGVNGRIVEVGVPGAMRLIDHGVHTEAVLDLEPGDGVTVYATCFTPGIAPAI
jgi:mannose-6-phosphate isomerase-like protein (cupin superfamily)